MYPCLPQQNQFNIRCKKIKIVKTILKKVKRSEAIPVTDLRGLQCLNNRLTDGGKVVSPKHRPHFTPQKDYISASGTHFS
jgi:hypothetical protein